MFKWIKDIKIYSIRYDIEILNISLLIARKLKSERKVLKLILNDIIYYSNYYPEKYNKIELEKELKELENIA